MSGPLAVLAGLIIGTLLADGTLRMVRAWAGWRLSRINTDQVATCALCGSREPGHAPSWCRDYLEACAELDAWAPDPPLLNTCRRVTLDRIRAGEDVDTVARELGLWQLGPLAPPAARQVSASLSLIPRPRVERQLVAVPGSTAAALGALRITAAGAKAIARALAQVAPGWAACSWSDERGGGTGDAATGQVPHVRGPLGVGGRTALDPGQLPQLRPRAGAHVPPAPAPGPVRPRPRPAQAAGAVAVLRAAESGSRGRPPGRGAAHCEPHSPLSPSGPGGPAGARVCSVPAAGPRAAAGLRRGSPPRVSWAPGPAGALPGMWSIGERRSEAPAMREGP